MYCRDNLAGVVQVIDWKTQEKEFDTWMLA